MDTLYNHLLNQKVSGVNSNRFFKRQSTKDISNDLWIGFLNDLRCTRAVNSTILPESVFNYLKHYMGENHVYYLAYTNLMANQRRYFQALWQFDDQNEANKYLAEMNDYVKDVRNSHVVNLTQCFKTGHQEDKYFAHDIYQAIDKEMAKRNKLPILKNHVIEVAQKNLPRAEAIRFISKVYFYNATLRKAAREKRYLTVDEYLITSNTYNKAKKIMEMNYESI